jgi:hypothetical protein
MTPARATRRRMAALGAWALAPMLALLPGVAAWAGAVEVRVTGAGGGPLPGAVVFLEPVGARPALPPPVPVDITQVERRFDPAVTVVPVGTPVSFPNKDTVRHHVYSFSPAKRFEIKLYIGTPAQPVVFDQPGIVVLGCNIHDNMTGWVVVVDTPWRGQTDARGQVAWPAVPAGRYRLRTWHPGLPPGDPPSQDELRVTDAPTQAAVALAGVRP